MGTWEGALTPSLSIGVSSSVLSILTGSGSSSGLDGPIARSSRSFYNHYTAETIHHHTPHTTHLGAHMNERTTIQNVNSHLEFQMRHLEFERSGVYKILFLIPTALDLPSSLQMYDL